MPSLQMSLADYDLALEGEIGLGLESCAVGNSGHGGYSFSIASTSVRADCTIVHSTMVPSARCTL